MIAWWFPLPPVRNAGREILGRLNMVADVNFCLNLEAILLRGELHHSRGHFAQLGMALATMPKIGYTVYSILSPPIARRGLKKGSLED